VEIPDIRLPILAIPGAGFFLLAGVLLVTTMLIFISDNGPTNHSGPAFGWTFYAPLNNSSSNYLLLMVAMFLTSLASLLLCVTIASTILFNFSTIKQQASKIILTGSMLLFTGFILWFVFSRFWGLGKML
jgi:hypothetical protein